MSIGLGLLVSSFEDTNSHVNSYYFHNVNDNLEWKNQLICPEGTNSEIVR